MSMLGKVKDYPAAVSGLVAAVVALHWGLYDQVHVFPDVEDGMAEFADAWQIYLGFAGVVAVTAGFASVVIVFALSATSKPFQTLRLRGGDRLASNWISPTAVCLGAAFGSVVCSVLAGTGHGVVAYWAFEFLLLLSATSGLRLLWLMRTIIRLVRRDDEASVAQEPAEKSLADILEHRQRA